MWRCASIGYWLGSGVMPRPAGALFHATLEGVPQHVINIDVGAEK